MSAIDSSALQMVDLRAMALGNTELHHAHFVAFRGDTYRLREKRRAGLLIRS
jgi:hypothetical protein